MIRAFSTFAKVRFGGRTTADLKRSITLFQCLPEPERFACLVSKCTELGINTFAPVISQNCTVDPIVFFNTRTKYQAMAVEMAKAVGRGTIPRVRAAVELKACDFSSFDLVLLAYEEEKERTLKSVLQGCTAQNIAIFIGPEGGITPQEVNLLQAKGAVSVTLGERVLYPDTAAVAMTAMLAYELEG